MPLDEKPESTIMERLRAISPPMTGVLISHRARTLSYRDLTVALDDRFSTAAPPRSAEEPATVFYSCAPPADL